MCSTGSSYMCVSNFNSKVRRVWHRIKFSVKTSQKSGLIVYSHKGSYRDYMYIAIQDGRMYYKSDLGTGKNNRRLIGSNLEFVLYFLVMRLMVMVMIMMIMMLNASDDGIVFP